MRQSSALFAEDLQGEAGVEFRIIFEKGDSSDVDLIDDRWRLLGLMPMKNLPHPGQRVLVEGPSDRHGGFPLSTGVWSS